ncbi:uncharacterized protein LOC134753381 [Cydia strobilella]|uniref:uncharacterized protein LOC134753381 n=1 Tax=Cydia strobilella TaxID=1100964 RepID=UPI003007DDD1
MMFGRCFLLLALTAIAASAPADSGWRCTGGLGSPTVCLGPSGAPRYSPPSIQILPPLPPCSGPAVVLTPPPSPCPGPQPCPQPCHLPYPSPCPQPFSSPCQYYDN